MRKKSKSGITINNDIALESIVEEQEKQPSPFTRNEFDRRIPIYHSPCVGKHKPKRERNGPVKHRYQEANRRNEVRNVIRCIQEPDITGCIVSVLLAAKKSYSLAQMQERIETILSENESGVHYNEENMAVVGDYQMRNAIGRLTRSKLGPHITVKDLKRPRKRTSYMLKLESINMSYDEAMKLANDVPKRTYAKTAAPKKSKPEPAEDPVKDLAIEIADHIMEKVVNVRVNVTFSFKVE